MNNTQSNDDIFDDVDFIEACLLREIKERSEWFDNRYSSGFMNEWDETIIDSEARQIEIMIAKDIWDVAYENSFHLTNS